MGKAAQSMLLHSHEGCPVEYSQSPQKKSPRVLHTLGDCKKPSCSCSWLVEKKASRQSNPRVQDTNPLTDWEGCSSTRLLRVMTELVPVREMVKLFEQVAQVLLLVQSGPNAWSTPALDWGRYIVRVQLSIGPNRALLVAYTLKLIVLMVTGVFTRSVNCILKLRVDRLLIVQENLESSESQRGVVTVRAAAEVTVVAGNCRATMNELQSFGEGENIWGVKLTENIERCFPGLLGQQGVCFRVVHVVVELIVPVYSLQAMSSP